MRPLPIRVRLTGWYLAVICATFVLFSLGMYIGVRKAIENTVDSQLSQRTENIEQFMNQHHPGEPSKMPQALPESSDLQPADELYQVMDASGALLYQSPSMRRLEIPADPHSSRRHHRDRGHYTTISRKHSDVRVLSARVDVAGGTYLVQTAMLVSPLYEVLSTFRVRAWFGLPFVLLLAGAGGYWLSGRAMKPVNNLVDAARGISERNLSQRLELPAADDELRDLAQTLNNMLGRLDAALTRNVRFTSDASHELRTPVAVIRTTAEVLLQRERSVVEYEEMVKGILVEAEFTTELIENLLTLARADSSTSALALVPTDTGALVQELEPGSQALATQRGLKWSCMICPEPITILADRQHLRRLLLILIDNALRYTPRDGTVRLTLTRERGQAVFTVVDSGIGIPEEELSRIFDRFHRAPNARCFHAEGSGLGLSIAQWIAAAHRGTVEVSSRVDEGTSMRLLIPLGSNQTKQGS